MQAILMTFVSDVALDVLRQRLERYTAALLSVPGFVMKAWIVEESVLGGFYLFENQAAADAYLQGEVCDMLILDTSFSYFKINRFDVIDDLSVIAGSPESTIRRELNSAPTTLTMTAG